MIARAVAVAVAFGLVFLASAEYSCAADSTNDYPASLFALVAPNALVLTNAAGYQLVAAGTTSIQVARRDSDWIFDGTDPATRITAERDTSGYSLSVNGRRIGRADESTAILGSERRTTVRTSDGYVTTIERTNSAALIFDNYYRK